MDDFTVIKNVDFSDNAELKNKKETFLLGKTGFNFLDNQYGLRPGFIHTILGRTGSGKTTLARSILVKHSFEHKILWYASEEALKDWKLHFDENNLPKAENIFFLAESDIRKDFKGKSVEDFMAFLEMQIEIKQAEIFFFDNITTSTFYNSASIQDQGHFSSLLQEMVERTNVACVCLAHIASSASRKPMFFAEDVRGNKTISNNSPFWYNIYRLRLTDEDSKQAGSSTILHVEKGRHSDHSDTAYQLIYEKRKGFIRDRPITWGIVKDFFKKHLRID